MGGFGKKGLSSTKAHANPKSGTADDLAKFNVTPHPWKMLFGSIASIGGAILMIALFLEGRGLVLSGIPLGVTGAKVFYGLMVLLCLAGMVFCGRGFLDGFGRTVWLKLDSQALTGPTRYNGADTVRLAYCSIQDMELKTYGDDQFLEVKGHDGRRIKVGSGNFRQKAEWPVFLKELDRRLDALSK